MDMQEAARELNAEVMVLRDVRKCSKKDCNKRAVVRVAKVNLCSDCLITIAEVARHRRIYQISAVQELYAEHMADNKRKRYRPKPPKAHIGMKYYRKNPFDWEYKKPTNKILSLDLGGI